MAPCYDSCHAAWLHCLEDVAANGVRQTGVTEVASIGSDFAGIPKPFLERCGTAFIICNPRNRVCDSAARRINLGFAIANFLWVLSGSDSLSDIEAFNPRAQQFADEGRLFGAPGRRVFSNSHSQVQSLIERLQTDSNSRRAVLLFAAPTDFESHQKDVPCLVSMQFLLRNGRLNCIAFMRSQSALMVMPYDLFLHTMIHEFISTQLGCALGTYMQICGSMHVYENEKELLQLVLDTKTIAAPNEMPTMQPLAEGDLSAIRSAFSAVTEVVAKSNGGNVDFEHYGVSDYWKELLTVLLAHYNTQFRSSISAAKSQLGGWEALLGGTGVAQ